MKNPIIMSKENRNENSQPHIHNIGADVESFDNVPEAAEETLASQEENPVEGEDGLDQIEALTKQLEEAKAQVAKEKNEYLFLMAEFDNFRKRTLREKSDIIRNAAENVLKGLLPIVDDFERGLEATAGASDSPAGWRS